VSSLQQARFEPVSRRTVSAEVREALIAGIRNGTLPAGSPLPPERALCEQFDVARTSVREALQGLVMIGMLEKRGNRSYVVERLPEVQFDAADRRKERVRELFEVRQVVEVPLARLAACRATESERKEILSLAAEFDNDMELHRFRELDWMFHTAVARASHNATLAELHSKVLESLFHSTEFDELLYSRSNREIVREVIRSAAHAHQAIARAIGEADWAAVVDASEAHLANVEEQMTARMV
jgi:GntR family transcriptional repressor for pyruvate dehydrogenase complex